MRILNKAPNFVHQLFKIYNISLTKGCSAVIVYYFSNKAKEKGMNLPLSSHLQTTLGCSSDKEQLTIIQPFDFDYLIYNKLQV